MMSCVPLAVEPPLASRHLPLPTSAPLLCAVQFCPAPPLQVASWTSAPSPDPVAVMHLPSERHVLPSRVHCWLVPPEHVHSWIFVPSAEPAPLTSTHLPPAPVMGPPVLPPPSSLTRMFRNDTSSPSPWFWMPMCPEARERTGSVLVKSFTLAPFRNTCT